MELKPAAAPRIDVSKLPYFNGFPYLATRLASAVYNIMLLPAEWSRDAMWDFALRQAGANGLPVCLVRDADRGEYFDPDKGRTQLSGIPRAGILPPGDLVPVDPIPDSPELRARAEALREYRRERHGSDWVALIGDTKKAGREGSLDEWLRLREPQAGGVPAGLVRCAECGEWKGECLDNLPREVPWLVRVHCVCENRNRCAGCGGLLGERKLNGNEYDEDTGRVIHYGGFAALMHGCRANELLARSDWPDGPLGRPVVRPEVVDRHDVGVIEEPSGPSFLLEPPETLVVLGERRGKHLDGHVPVEPGIAGPVDLAHPARAQGARQFIGAEGGAQGEAHPRAAGCGWRRWRCLFES